MILLLASMLQAVAAPAPAAGPELLDLGTASVVTDITLDQGGRPSGCETHVAGMQGQVDGCLLFAKPDLLAGWLGQPLTGFGTISVRLTAVPADSAPEVPGGAVRRTLAAATISVSREGMVSRCTASPGSFDLCRLLPTGGAAFKPDPAGPAERRLDVSFALVAVRR